MWKDPVTGEMKGGVQKTSYSHEALIDAILENPTATQNEIAARFGYTPGWISQIISSDAFQAALATRKEQIVDPMLRGAADEAFKGLMLQSMHKLREKLEANPSDNLCLEVLNTSSRDLGYGARLKLDATVQHNHSLIGVLSSLPPVARLKDVTPALPEPVSA